MSGFQRPLGKGPDGLQLPMGIGDWNENPNPITQSTDSNQVISALAIVGRLYIRSGQTAGRTDTTDTAANILAAMPGMDVNDSIRVTVSNQAAQVLTIAGGTGVTITSTKTTILSSGAATLLFTKTGAATMNLFIV